MQGLANNRYDEIPPHKVKKHFKKSIAKKKKKKRLAGFTRVRKRVE